MATDEQIKRAVMVALQRDERLSPDSLDVQVQQQVVTLSGVVDSYADKRAAEHAAYRVHSVKRVVNHVQVHEAGIVEHSDAEIAKTAMVKLQGDRFLPADQVTVTVSQGRITLQGDVSYDFQKVDAERDVMYLDGVLGVQNLLTVQPGAEAATPLEEGNVQSQ
jgi:osmotically-inducible protein OsmY